MYGYSYFTSQSKNMILKEGNVDSDDSPLKNTIEKIKGGYILLWNDESPDGKSHGTGAHSKGILYYDP